MTKEKKDKLEKWQSDLTKSELKLEGLYEEWSALEAKLAKS